MYITYLSLTNFRNYEELSFEVPPNISVFWGANAQGKTNLLESISFLATTRFSRSIPDKEIINRHALSEKMPLCHLRADIRKRDKQIQIEIFIKPKNASFYESSAEGLTLQKHIRINGIARRATDLMGQLNMVMFSPRDIDLIGGEPSLRRRYLDITISQIDPRYLKALQRYNRVISQRNHLLRRIAAGHGRPDELPFWNSELIKTGSYIISQRKETVFRLDQMAMPIHHRLTGGQEDLGMEYLASIQTATPDITYIENSFNELLNACRDKEISRGQSLVGPHRDDLAFVVNGINMGPYGSRGQQRTAALSLKLAESELIVSQTGETPVLLLDDVLSELDSHRREHLLEAIYRYQQVLITTTDLDRFPADFIEAVEKYEIRNGAVL